MDDAYPEKKFNSKIIFNVPLFGYMGAAQLLDCTTARTTNQRVIKGELLCGYHFYSAIWDTEIGEQVHVVCLSLIINAIDMWLL